MSKHFPDFISLLLCPDAVPETHATSAGFDVSPVATYWPGMLVAGLLAQSCLFAWVYVWDYKIFTWCG